MPILINLGGSGSAFGRRDLKSRKLINCPRSSFGTSVDFFMSNRLYPALHLYSRLVSSGYRDAYLVDGALAALSPAAVVKQLQVLGLDTLRVLELGSADMLLIDAGTLRSRIESLQEAGSWDDYRFPVLVQVDPEPGVSSPRFLSESERFALAKCLLSCTKHLLFELDHGAATCLELENLPLLEQAVGLPFVAGWLLGYPCIYKKSAESPFNLLSMQRLVKFSISGRVAPSGARDTAVVEVDLLEFTVPLCLLEADPARSQQLKQVLADKMARLSALCEATGAILDSVSIAESEHQLPSVML